MGIDHRTSRRQIKTLKATPFWDRELTIRATFMEAGTNELIQRFFLRWYSNKDVVPTLEAMQKMIVFYHDKDFNMLNHGCALPNLLNICLHNSTDANFYPFNEGDKDLLETIREDVVCGTSIVFTRKAVVDETFNRKTTNLCKSSVGNNAGQLYPYSMCQPMPAGLYRLWDSDSETSRLLP